MTRGRSRDLSLPLTRALAQQREYRARKAAKLHDLEAVNEELRQENEGLKEDLRRQDEELQRVRARLADAERALSGQVHPALPLHRLSNGDRVKPEEKLEEMHFATKRKRSEVMEAKSASSSPSMRPSYQPGPSVGAVNVSHVNQYPGPEPSGYQLQSASHLIGQSSPYNDATYPIRPPSPPVHMQTRPPIVLPLPIPRQVSSPSLGGCHPGSTQTKPSSDKCCGPPKNMNNSNSSAVMISSPLSTPGGMSPSQSGGNGSASSASHIPVMPNGHRYPKHASSLPLPTTQSQSPSFPIDPAIFRPSADAASPSSSSHLIDPSLQSSGSRSNSLSTSREHDMSRHHGDVGGGGELPHRPLPQCILESSEKNICCQGLFDCSGLPAAVTSNLHQMSTEYVAATAAGRSPPELPSFIDGGRPHSEGANGNHSREGLGSHSSHETTNSGSGSTAASQADAELLLALPARQESEGRHPDEKQQHRSKAATNEVEKVKGTGTTPADATDKECCWGVMDCAPAEVAETA